MKFVNREQSKVLSDYMDCSLRSVERKQMEDRGLEFWLFLILELITH